MKERSLVVFTLLVQLAIGAFWMLGILCLWATVHTNAETARQLTVPAFLGVIPIMAAALLVSLLHLGTPLNAWRAAVNLRSSWLSREIIFSLLFTVLEAAFAWLHWQQTEQGWLRLLLALAAALAGGLALYSMTRLYMLRTVSSWNTWMTPAAFIISTLLLGSLTAGVGLAANPEALGDLLRLPLTWIGLLAVFLLGARAVITTLSAAGQEPKLLIMQMSLLAFALSICSMLLYQSALFEFSGQSAALNWLVMLAFLAALGEEAMGRWLFYLSFERVGI